MKTTIDLPDSLALSLKITAARRGKAIKSLATESFRAAMQATDASPPRAVRGKITLPLFPSATRTVRHRVKLPLIKAEPGALSFELTGQRIHELEMESEMESYDASLRQ